MTTPDLEGAVAAVTGAAGGLGAASAQALAARGATVMILDRDMERAADVAKSIDGETRAIACDVSDEASVEAAFGAIADEFGRLDVLHSNAGIFLGNGQGDDGLETAELEVWRRTLDVNLIGGFLCVRSAVAMMLNGSGGSIVLTSSTAGALIGSPSLAYSAAKAGLVGFMRGLVIRYARRGIRVNTICPGPFNTEMSQTVRDDDQLRTRLIDRIPAGRIGEPDDVGNLVAFLASPASSYLNGCVIPIEGGLTLD